MLRVAMRNESFLLYAGRRQKHTNQTSGSGVRRALAAFRRDPARPPALDTELVLTNYLQNPRF
jgi:hypothetical protein